MLCVVKTMHLASSTAAHFYRNFYEYAAIGGDCCENLAHAGRNP
jgi:hypothetical protein